MSATDSRNRSPQSHFRRQDGIRRLTISINAVGINAATGFADNTSNFTIDYSGTGHHIVYIDDFYDVNAKFAAVTAHIDLDVGSDARGQLVWPFASGYSGIVAFPIVSLALFWQFVPAKLCTPEYGMGHLLVSTKTIDYLVSKKGWVRCAVGPRHPWLGS